MKNKYLRKIITDSEGLIDVYSVLQAFEVDPVLVNAVKKLLMAGKRGYKDQRKDLEEAVFGINRKLEMLNDEV